MYNYNIVKTHYDFAKNVSVRNPKLFKYNSTQTHTSYVKGKERIKTHTVRIKGKIGHKLVTIKENGRRKTSKKKLTMKEINCIRKCQFVPGLFKDCMDCLRN